MGKKHKQAHGSKKSQIGNKVAGVKKAKTKTVTTNLKKLNFHNKARTASIDKEFNDIQKVVISGKGSKQSSDQKSTEKQKMADDRELPDVDSAMDSMENLTMPKS